MPHNWVCWNTSLIEDVSELQFVYFVKVFRARDRLR